MKHRIGLTVTDPNHPMVSKRKETIQKTVRVSGEDREKAINSAIAHYRRKGYKVHDHHYIGSVNEEIMSVADTYKKLAVKHMKDKHKAETEKQRRYAHTMHLRALQAAKMDNHTDALNHYRGVKEEVQVDEADAFKLGHNAHEVKAQLKSNRQSAETKAKSIAAQAINKTKTDAEMKEDIQIVDEAWNQGNRNPQKGIKVGHKVRSYDFPGMHDDHYVEGHVVGETPHSYHIRVNKVVRGGKEIPTPTHMSHVEAPKGKGMFSNAYGVHKIMAKQEDAAAAPEPAKGGAKTFANVRGKKK